MQKLWICMLGKIIKEFNGLKKRPLKCIIKSLDYHCGLGFLERGFFCNWFNPLYTIYLNFRSFPLRQAICLPIFVYGHPRFYGLTGDMLIKGKITPGMIHFNRVMTGAPSNMSVQSEILNLGTIIFHGKGLIGTGNKIKVASSAVLEVGANFKITDMCNIGCCSKIFIGEQSWVVHRCQVIDSNFHYVSNWEKGMVPKQTAPIFIGKGCWICNTTTITGGAVLPNFTIVASNSLVGKDYSFVPESSMIGGIPAKLIKTGLRKVDNSKIENRVNSYYRENPNGLFRISKDDTMDEYSFVDKFK